ncbi:hypothetical protein [Chitinimonas sp. BJYL2]|uniref:glycoside hydrolase family 38 N-terminal domain-containing protein n=1 Tax=Chitinimonas sp. BJYL2 TaxID=2976696 RepID=UPI0022B520AD|nr:hypothetical protein [Chitinimonas sp. BJYL2]
MSTYQVGVVVQTHWDREWYFSHQRFMARLLAVMETVAGQLERGELQYFLFDGQTAALEDLLREAEPALAQRVRALAAAGKLQLGPWYVMADGFLAHGEALLRNLELGLQDARAAGSSAFVGYLPDTFGHPSQMPQLLRHMGLDSAVLWRGLDHPHSELDWAAPDGSVVPTLYLTQGYYQHPLNVADWEGALQRYLDQIRPRALTPHLLLTQGGDHLLPVEGIAERIARWNAQHPDCPLIETSLPEQVARTLAASEGRRGTVRGELRANIAPYAFVLPDVLSTRRYLKRLNQQAEDRLLGEIEPLWAALTVAAWPARYLEHSWRLLIQQQAHDSICGCSVDSVHDEMLTRYAQLDERLDALRDQALSAGGLIALRQHEAHPGGVFADDSRLTFFNPLPQARRETVLISVFLAGTAHAGLTLRSPCGEAMPTALLDCMPARVFRSPLDDFPDVVEGHRYTLAVPLALDGLATSACTVEPAEGAASPPMTPGVIANGHVRIALDADGRLHWQDLRLGDAPLALCLLSELDAGDSYNYAPPPQQHAVLHERFTLESQHHAGLVQELVLAFSMTVPAGLDADRQGASAEQVSNTGTLRLRLIGDSAEVDVQLVWTNRAKDQRTRLLLPLPAETPGSWADSAFDWTWRPLRRACYPASPSKQEMPVAVNPSNSAVLAADRYVLHRGLQEFELLEHAGRAWLGLTLVRSVGWLSRRDLVTRGVGAGPDMATPGAQCLGEDHADFRLGRLLPGEAAHAVLTRAQAFRRPVLTLRGHGTQWGAPLDIANPTVQISALRRVGDVRELRIWNPTDTVQDFQLPAGWTRVNGLGQAMPEQIRQLAPRQLQTWRVKS